MHWPGGAVEVEEGALVAVEEEGDLAAEEATAVAEVAITEARMGSMAAAWVIPARPATVPMGIRTTAPTSRLQNPAVATVIPVPPTSSRTTTSTMQTRRPRSRRNTTRRILFRRTTKTPKSSCRTSKMPPSTTMIATAITAVAAVAAVAATAITTGVRMVARVMEKWQVLQR